MSIFEKLYFPNRLKNTNIDIPDTVVEDHCINMTQHNNSDHDIGFFRGSFSLVSDDRVNVLFDYSFSRFLDNVNQSYAVESFRSNQYLMSVFHKSKCMDEIYIDDDCFLIPGWGPFSWGHFLHDFLPRLLLLQTVPRYNINDLYISSLTPSYIIDAISYVLNITGCNFKIKFFNNKTVTRFSKATVPSFMNLGDGFHSYLHNLLTDFLSKVSSIYIPEFEDVDQNMIYVSRKHDGWYKSITNRSEVVNEEIIHKIVSRFGIKIIHFEDFDFLQKINLMSRAKLMCGCWGSGLLNSLVSPVSLKILSIGVGFNYSLDHVAKIRGHDLIYSPTYDASTKVLVNRTNYLESVNVCDEGLLKTSIERILG